MVEELVIAFVTLSLAHGRLTMVGVTPRIHTDTPELRCNEKLRLTIVYLEVCVSSIMSFFGGRSTDDEGDGKGYYLVSERYVVSLHVILLATCPPSMVAY